MNKPKPPNLIRRKNENIILQPRDYYILLLLHESKFSLKSQLIHFFFNGKSSGGDRLRKLVDHGYINVNHKPAQWEAYPQTIYWISKLGCDVISDYFQRLFNHQGSSKLRNMQAITLKHHFDIITTRLRIMIDVSKHTAFHLSQWTTESYFNSDAWKMGENISGEIPRFIPDGQFSIWTYVDQAADNRLVYPFMLEVDRGHHSLKKLADKFKAGKEFMESDLYSQAFPVSSGRHLFITKAGRLKNAMKTCVEVGAGDVWLFADSKEVASFKGKHNVAFSPIWRQPVPNRRGFEKVTLISG